MLFINIGEVHRTSFLERNFLYMLHHWFSPKFMVEFSDEVIHVRIFNPSDHLSLKHYQWFSSYLAAFLSNLWKILRIMPCCLFSFMVITHHWSTSSSPSSISDVNISAMISSPWFCGLTFGHIHHSITHR